MEERRIFPDFNKLKDYYPSNTIEQTALLNKMGVTIESEYYNKEYYHYLADSFVNIAKRNKVQEHYNELLYLILKGNEELVTITDIFWDNYNDDKISSEVGKFLLAFKDTKPNQDFQLVAKTITGNVAIKNPVIAKWMTELIYNAIEQGNLPFEVFGEKINYNLFGSELQFGNITMERLEATANIKPKNPKSIVKEYLVRFCLYLRPYLINQTELISPKGIFLTDAQSNFFFDVLELLGHIHRLEIESEPKDYMATMIRNNTELKPLL